MAKVVKKIAIGAAIAGAAGYIAGLLTAPKSGRETRQDLGRTAEMSAAEVEKQLKSLHTELGKLIDDAKDHGGSLNDKAKKELKDLVEKAKDSKEKARQVISAIHEGDADDKDLSRAVEDAKHAIEHLRDFYRK